MAYEDLYGGTEDIPVGGDYWVRIRTTLTHDQKERADRHLHKVEATLDDKGKMRGVASPDMESYRRAIVTAAICAWNLDEADGSLWQISPDNAKHRNVGRLPEAVFEAIFDRVDALNKMDTTEERAFRLPTAGRDSDGDSGTADSATVPDGSEAVDEAWDTSGAPG